MSYSTFSQFGKPFYLYVHGDVLFDTAHCQEFSQGLLVFMNKIKQCVPNALLKSDVLHNQFLEHVNDAGFEQEVEAFNLPFLKCRLRLLGEQKDRSNGYLCANLPSIGMAKLVTMLMKQQQQIKPLISIYLSSVYVFKILTSLLFNSTQMLSSKT